MENIESFIWEKKFYYKNYIDKQYRMTQKNIYDFSVSSLDILCFERDEDYNIHLTCVGDRDRIVNEEIKKNNENEVGASIQSGSIELCMYDGVEITIAPCYCFGKSWSPSTNKINYNLQSYRIEGNNSNKDIRLVKEWLLNGDIVGQLLMGNKAYDYKTESMINVNWGPLAMSIDKPLSEKQIMGRYTHINYKDTGFDISYADSEHAPKWSRNLCITYIKDYGRIPTQEERAFIRDYLSFFIGRKLIYVGETSFDGDGNISGFVMESPNSYGFDIKNICSRVSKPPIRNDLSRDSSFIELLQKYIEDFEYIYKKLEMGIFFTSFWYAREISQPFDLPILAGVFEYLQKQWYSKCENNPNTLYMDSDKFKKHIKNIRKTVLEEFKNTQIENRVVDGLYKINEMSVNSRFQYFIKEIGINLDKDDSDSIYERNKPTHGELKMGSEDYNEQIRYSNIYQVLIYRVVLKLIGFDGKYIDYGMVGYPEKEIDK